MESIVMFISLVSLLGPSILCTLFLFYQFIRLPQLRRQSRNFLVICLLIMNFIQLVVELPPRLYFLYTRIIIFPYPQFCDLWNWCQFTFVSVNLLTIALGSVERYLLIFDQRFVSNHLILLRQIPLLLCILSPIIFYSITIYGVQCETTYIYSNIGCGLPCFFFISTFAVIFKNIVMICAPVILTIVTSALLLIRVYIQRKKMQRQRNFWKENVKMIIQLLPIIILYLVVWIPLSVLFYFSTFGTQTQKLIVRPLINDYFGNLKYFVNLIYPFLVLLGQTELRNKFKNTFYICLSTYRRNRVSAIPLTNSILPRIQ